MDAVTRLLSDLVAIPSVNPMGRALSGPTVLETRMSDYLERYFRDLGVPYRRHEVRSGRDNVIAKYEAPGGRRTILFDVHQDTVPTDGMTIDPFLPKIEGGKLFGRGSCDVKGGMAAMLAAFARLVAEKPSGSASVILACTVDEEFTHVGSSRLAEERPDVDLAIVAEPTRLDLVTTHKGAVRWKIRSHGVACHSSTPHLGDNAIYRMARVVTALSDYALVLSRATPDPILGPPSLSVGRIDGGVSVNVVPDWCEIEVDRRVIPGEMPESVPGEAAAFLRERLGSLDGLEFLPPWVNMPALSPNMRETDLAAMSDVIASATGRTPSRIGVPYGTDAGPLGQAGIPCVVFGPGDIAQAHTKDEWIELDEVRVAAELYYRMAVALG
ncbi:MAG: acetylornithine deacetylase or succinyl-diaminopimelate desuccinylase [Planctomycetota bacterium]|nr:acetylornithine deacetylase or succinyl-diaminopimelate desuccinylase [Planctomycetota bacterium]